VTPESLLEAVSALKQTVETLTRQRKPVSAAAVTWADLVSLGLITPDRVPSK
jgi:hypothetical protein